MCGGGELGCSTIRGNGYEKHVIGKIVYIVIFFYTVVFPV